jgi:AraC-like DNA-binding protein
VAETRGIWTWPAGSLWLGRGSARNERHSHYAVQVSVGVDGPGRLAIEGETWRDFDVAVVRSAVAHGFDPMGRFLAQVMVEPISPYGSALSALLGDRPALFITDGVADAVRSVVEPVREAALSRAAYLDTAFRILEELTSVAPPATAVDARVAAMCEHVRRHVADTRITLAQVAAAACLSPDRARHLFREHTGLSVRAYVLWTRLNLALELLPAASQLTAVAHECGFADAAHFTRTFRHVYGITPSGLLKSSFPVQRAESDAALQG